jgi:hypothetical protein
MHRRDDFHVIRLNLGCIRSRARQIPVGVSAFHHRSEKRRIFFAESTLRGFDVRRGLDHRPR